MSDDPAVLVGREVGGFQLERVLGQGAMSVVYEGRSSFDPSIRRAIKIVRPTLTEQPEFVARFSEEARVLEGLAHPNIVGFYGIRRVDGWLLMELEYLQGTTLADAAQHSGSVGKPLGWMEAVARGVGKAHEAGIVHRDLKPENVFLTDDGRICVLDFGIARALDESTRASHSTKLGQTPGTPAYMAPEVCEGRTPTPSADVYAIGLMVWELLVGHHPFVEPGTTPTEVQMMYAHVKGAVPPLNRVRPELSSALANVVQRATHKDPTERFSTANELADALAAVQAEGTTRRAGAATTSLDLPVFRQAGTSGSVTSTSPPTARLVRLLLPGLVGFGAGCVATLAVVGSLYSPPPSPVADGAQTVAWVSVQGANGNVTLGLPDGVDGSGFHSDRAIPAPAQAFQIQSHEVTWQAFAPWAKEHPEHHFQPPRHRPIDPTQRARTPVAGIPWPAAEAYCQSLNGHLPTEEQFEFAARGAELRPAPWGSQPLDPDRTLTALGIYAHPAAVGTSPQDRTPGARPIFDLAGNVSEWTLGLYREDRSATSLCSDDAECIDTFEDWVTDGGNRYRTLRGLALDGDRANVTGFPATARRPMCAEGPCVSKLGKALDYVGFRCVREVPLEVEDG